MLENPDTHVSELVARYKGQSDCDTTAVESKEEEEEEEKGKEGTGMAMEVRNWLGTVVKRFTQDRRRGVPVPANEGWRRKGRMASRWWRNGVEVLMRV